VKLNSSPFGLDFQRQRLHRASLSGAIALFDLLSTELLHFDTDSSICVLTKVAAQLLRRVQAGEVVEEVEWIESFVRAQQLFEFKRSSRVNFEIESTPS